MGQVRKSYKRMWIANRTDLTIYTVMRVDKETVHRETKGNVITTVGAAKNDTATAVTLDTTVR